MYGKLETLFLLYQLIVVILVYYFIELFVLEFINSVVQVSTYYLLSNRTAQSSSWFMYEYSHYIYLHFSKYKENVNKVHQIMRIFFNIKAQLDVMKYHNLNNTYYRYFEYMCTLRFTMLDNMHVIQFSLRIVHTYIIVELLYVCLIELTCDHFVHDNFNK